MPAVSFSLRQICTGSKGIFCSRKKVEVKSQKLPTPKAKLKDIFLDPLKSLALSKPGH